MLRKLTILTLLFLLASCGKSPTDARKELVELNVPFEESACEAYAAKSDEIVTDLFLASDIDPGCLISGGVVAGNTELIKKALQKSEFNPGDDFASEGLEQAINSKQDDLAKLLIEKEVKSPEAFSSAASLGNIDLVKLFLQKGVNPNYDPESANNSPALCSAVKSGQKEMVKLLLDNKANPNSKFSLTFGNSGSPCLLYALADNQTEIAQMLREAGAVDSFITGNWQIDYEIKQTVDSTGKVSDASGYYNTNKTINLIQNKSVITGKLIEASSDSCSDAEINGKIVDNNIDWTLTYTGNCCPGTKSSYSGKVSYNLDSLWGEQIKIVGNVKPLTTPPPDCNLWIGDIEASKVQQ
jgi:hypothetical protein